MRVHRLLQPDRHLVGAACVQQGAAPVGPARSGARRAKGRGWPRPAIHALLPVAFVGPGRGNGGRRGAGFGDGRILDQRAAHRLLNGAKERARIAEADLGLGGVDVDVDVAGVYLEKSTATG